MTEAEWLAGADAYQMMLRGPIGEVSPRKLRLFPCAVARRLWGRLNREEVRRAVELAELVADGHAPDHELETAYFAALTPERDPQGNLAASIAANSADPDAWHATMSCAGNAHMTGLGKAGVVAILREVFGNPFRVVSLDRGWLTPDAAALARSVYEEHTLPGGELDAMRLAILADMLEEAGCWNAELLGRLRGPGPGVVAILREISGEPLRAVPLDRGWLAADAVALARSVYEERALPSGELDATRLATLADMIEDAGCWDAELLRHLRGPGPHVRGCWGGDLLLGRD